MVRKRGKGTASGLVGEEGRMKDGGWRMEVRFEFFFVGCKEYGYGGWGSGCIKCTFGWSVWGWLVDDGWWGEVSRWSYSRYLTDFCR